MVNLWLLLPLEAGAAMRRYSACQRCEELGRQPLEFREFPRRSAVEV